MICPSCNRPNPEGCANCDYCGTPLRTALSKVEAEHAEPSRSLDASVKAPMGGPAPVDDPFAPPHRDTAGLATAGAFTPNLRRSLGSTGAPSKRKTEFDAALPADQAVALQDVDDVFAPPRVKVAVGRRVVGWLVTFDGYPDGCSFVLREGRNGVGRDPANDVAIPGDPMLSGTHAYVIWRGGRARIADNNSQNGTFVNDEDVIGQVDVRDNDVIRVGRTRLIVRLLDQEKVASTWKPAGSV